MSAFLLQIEDARPVSFVDTRSRRTDSQTSRDAAKHAATAKAASERRAICAAIQTQPMTAREASAFTGIDYYTVQRRISETGLVKTDEQRDGCRVWRTAA